MVFMERYKKYIANIEIDNIYQEEDRKTENYTINGISYINNDYYKNCTVNINLVGVNGRDFICHDPFNKNTSYWHYYDQDDYGIKKYKKYRDSIHIYVNEVLCLGEKCLYIIVEIKHQTNKYNFVQIKFENTPDSKLGEIIDVFTRILKYRKNDLLNTQYLHYINNSYILTISEMIGYNRGKIIFSLFD